MATDNRQLMDGYLEALCGDCFAVWNRFHDFTQRLTDNNKPCFLENIEETASLRQSVGS